MVEFDMVDNATQGTVIKVVGVAVRVVMRFST